MKKIWTIVASALVAASVSFAQDELENESADQPEEQFVEQDFSPDPEDVSEQEPSDENGENTQDGNQAITQESNGQAAPYNEAETSADPEQYEKRHDAKPKFGFGIRAAFDYGMMYGFKEEDDDVDETPSGFGFEGGLTGRIMLVSNLFFTPELNIAYISTKHKYNDIDRTYKSLDLEIPFLMRGVVIDKFYVAGGPQININVNNDYEFDSDEGIFTENIDQTKFTFGLAVGAGLNIVEGLFIDLRFYMGLKELYPDVKSVGDYSDGGVIDEGDKFSYINMKGAKMMKIKAGLSYWFI